MPIRVEINAKNVELTDQLRDYVTKKVGKLDRYLDVLQHANVDLNNLNSARNAGERQVAQLTVRGKGVMLRAEERSDDIFASVDAALDKIVRQIDRYKGRHWKPRGDGRSAADLFNEWDSEAEDADDEFIMRRKRFQLLPMDVIEARQQMELLGHELFFVYLDANTGNVNVLYRRRDGSYGLIETEIA